MGFVTYFKDTLQNLITGLGQFGIDSTQNVQYILNLLDRNTLENMYRGDWLARKICDAPADDMTREWRAWQANQQQIEALELVEKTMDLQRKVKNWIIRARLYGGSALVIGVDDGNSPSDPIDLEKCKKNCLKYVVVLNRYELNAGPRIYNVTDPYYTRPAYYTVATPMFGFSGEAGVTMPSRTGQPEPVPGSLTNFMSNVLPFGKKAQRGWPSTTPTNIGLEQIHPSRVLEFPGNELPDWRLAPLGGGWGDSVLQTTVDTMNSFTQTYQSVSAMVADGKLDVVKIPDMSTNLTNQDYKNRLIDRFTLSAQTKSVISALLLDKEEEWNRVTTNYAGLPMIIHEFITLLSGAAKIPVSILFGQAYGRGMEGGSTGGGGEDVRNYYDGCTKDQKNEIAPRIGMLDQVLMRSALGREDPNVHYEWNALWQLKDAEKAQIGFQKAQATQIYATIGIINEDALREGVVNQLIEDGTYPGLDDAIEEYGAEPEEPEDLGGYLPGPNGNGGGSNGGGEPNPEMIGHGAAMDEERGHPFRGNQYTTGESGGEQQELPLVGGSGTKTKAETKRFLNSTVARKIIGAVANEAIHAGEHISKHHVELGLIGAVEGALLAMGVPAAGALTVGAIAGYAVHRLASKLHIEAETAHHLLQRAVRGLRSARERSLQRAARMGAHPGHFPTEVGFGFGDADDHILYNLRALDHVLSTYSTEQLTAHMRGRKVGDRWGPAQWEASAAARHRMEMLARHHDRKAAEHDAKAEKAKDEGKAATHRLAASSHREAAKAYRHGDEESGRLHGATAHYIAHGGKDAATVYDFDPEEPRDPRGRWTSGGGGGLLENVLGGLSGEEVFTGEAEQGHERGMARLAALRGQWAYLDKQLFQYNNEGPNDPVVKKLVGAQLAITKRIHDLQLSEPGAAGIGLPGDIHDVVVVGAGPSGLSAGIYGGSEGLNTLVVEGGRKVGGQAGASSRIENVMGFPVGLPGDQLVRAAATQAQRLGAEIRTNKQAAGLSYDPGTGLKTVTFTDGTHVQSRAVVIAGGVQFNHVNIPGSDSPDVVYGSSGDLKARVKEGDALIVGGANSAGQAAMDTAITSRHVTLVARGGLDKMSDYLVKQIESHPRISVVNGEITAINKDKDGRMAGAVLKDGTVLPAKGVLYAIGSKPKTDWATGIERNERGFIKVGGEGRAPLETNIPGVFAAGDVRAGSIGRVITAAADGAAAISMTHGYLAKLRADQTKAAA